MLWSLDFSSPLNLMFWHNQYVLIVIEYFSKWLELVPLQIVIVKQYHKYFFIRCLVDFGLQLKFSLTKVWNFVRSFKSYVSHSHHVMGLAPCCFQKNLLLVWMYTKLFTSSTFNCLCILLWTNEYEF